MGKPDGGQALLAFPYRSREVMARQIQLAIPLWPGSSASGKLMARPYALWSEGGQAFLAFFYLCGKKVARVMWLAMPLWPGSFVLCLRHCGDWFCMARGDQELLWRLDRYGQRLARRYFAK